MKKTCLFILLIIICSSMFAGNIMNSLYKYYSDKELTNRNLREMSYIPLNVGNQWWYTVEEGGVFNPIPYKYYYISDSLWVEDKPYFKGSYFGLPGTQYWATDMGDSIIYIDDTDVDHDSTTSYLKSFDFSYAIGQAETLYCQNPFYPYPKSTYLQLCTRDSINLTDGSHLYALRYYYYMTEIPSASGYVDFAQGIGITSWSNDFFYASLVAWKINGVRYGDWSGVPVDEPAPDIIQTKITCSNYPNPFNPSTNIVYDIPASEGNCILIIYNLKGQIITKVTVSGKGSFIWNGVGNNNQKIASGLYFYQITGKNHKSGVKKMIIIK